jgi:hypothetical protein
MIKLDAKISKMLTTLWKIFITHRQSDKLHVSHRSALVQNLNAILFTYSNRVISIFLNINVVSLKIQVSKTIYPTHCKLFFHPFDTFFIKANLPQCIFSYTAYFNDNMHKIINPYLNKIILAVKKSYHTC